jgi:valyl-tRNA synthetase
MELSIKKTLKLFSDKERDHHAYQARQNYLREQRTIQIEREEDHREMERIKQEMEQAQQDLERERFEKQAALQEKETALQREQSAQAEIERLKALLAQSKQ